MLNPYHHHSSRRAFFLLQPQFWISAAIIAFFATMMFLLWRREVALDYTVQELGITPDFLTATWVDYEQYMWLERGDERIGVYVMTVRRDEDAGTFKLIGRSRLGLDLLGVKIPIAVDTEVMMTERFEMDVFHGRLLAGGENISAEAFVEDLDLFYEIKGNNAFVTNGGFTSTLKLGDPVMLADAIRPVVTQSERLRVGETWTTRASDPITGNLNVVVTVTVEAIEPFDTPRETIRAFRVTERAGEMVTTSWYDSAGEILKTDLGNGLVMTRAIRELVYDQHPDLKLPPIFDDIDRERIRNAAAAATETDEAPLPWWPNL